MMLSLCVVSLSLSVYSKHSRWLMTPFQALGSLHTNLLSVYPPSTSYLRHSCLISLPYSLCPSSALWVYNPLYACTKRFGGKHTATGQCLVRWICWMNMFREDKKKGHSFSLEYNIIHLMSIEIVPQRLNSRSLCWPASSTLLWCLFDTVSELDVP